jgi:PX domain-containing protein kinase-like protein
MIFTFFSLLFYRNNVKYQYSAILDSAIGAPDRNPRERAARDRAFSACSDWLISSGGRYEIIAHLDDIGSRSSKHWFLLNDSTVSDFYPISNKE